MNKIGDTYKCGILPAMGQGRTGKGGKRSYQAEYVFEDYADFNPERAQSVFSEFLKTGLPVDCVICNNDNMAAI